MRPNYLLGLASIAVLALTGPGLQAQSTSGFVLGEKSLQLTIPDLDPSGVARSQTVSGLAEGLIYDLTVRLVVEGTGFGAFNGDYYAYLRHETPDGSQSELVVLLNRVGRGAGLPSGYSESGFNVTFSDAATWDIHRYQVALGGATDGPLTGTWQPDGRRVNPLVSLDTSARTTSLEPLGTMNPNGSWALFIADMEAGGTGKLVEWEVRGTPRAIIPEPSSMALLWLGAVGLGWILRRRGPAVD
jgi:hypothetical protein